MDRHFLHEFSHAAESHGVYAEDFVDRLCSRYTSLLLLLLAGANVMRQYVFKPIQCWVPAEWPRPWEEFAENYCWTQNTYRVAMRDPSHPAASERGELALSYYQWVPIVLTAQALLSLIPHQLWLMVSRRLTGFDPHSVLRFAREVEHSGEPETAKRLLTYAAWQLAWGAGFRGRSPTDETSDGTMIRDDGRRRGCSEAMRQSGCALFVLYMVCKLVQAGTALGQVFFLQSFLGFSSPLFGWQCASNLLRGGQWEQTLVFPRVTFCDLPLRHVGQWNLRSVQCVLASNMVNEKIYIFLWFWFVFCCLVSLVNIVCWLVQLLPPTDRRRLLRRYLRLQQSHGSRLRHLPDRENHSASVDEQSDRLARLLLLDGVFLVQMVGDNVDCLCAARLLGRLLKARKYAFDICEVDREDDEGSHNGDDSGVDSGPEGSGRDAGHRCRGARGAPHSGLEASVV